EDDADEKDPEIVAFKTVKLTESEITEKSYFPQAILDKAAEGTEFKDLMLKYSDSILSYVYADGVMIHKDGYFVNNETVMSAARALEIGKVSDAVSISDGEYQYIIKRIPLAEKAYEDEKFADLFTDYKDVVVDAKYEELTKPYTEAVIVDSDTIGKYTMKGIYTAPVLDMQGSTQDQ
ncbi:MAG: hypothetical protein MJ101_05170, partial [Clostridia bacterium]|nr:hypothetical protein [Clostridia bacterium]